jgi:hypothetical protein
VSYNSLRRRGGSNEPADAHARQVPADLHEGTAVDFLRRHERESASAARGSKAEKAALVAVLFKRVADSRNLKVALDHVARGGGSAGPDGIVPSDFAPCRGRPQVRLSLIAEPPRSSWYGSSVSDRSARRQAPGPMGSGTAWTRSGWCCPAKIVRSGRRTARGARAGPFGSRSRLRRLRLRDPGPEGRGRTIRSYISGVSLSRSRLTRVFDVVRRSRARRSLPIRSRLRSRSRSGPKTVTSGLRGRGRRGRRQPSSECP